MVRSLPQGPSAPSPLPYITLLTIAAALQDTTMWIAKSSERKVFDEVLELQTLPGTLSLLRGRRNPSGLFASRIR